MRVGVYIADLVYRRDGAVLSTEHAVVRFAAALAPQLGEVVLFGRLHPEPGRDPYELPADGIGFVPLPYYRNVAAVGQLLRSLRSARRTFVAELSRLDAVLLFGPHPLALAFALAARRRGVPVVLGIRQDLPRYIAPRLPGPLWAWALPAAQGLETAYRLLARTTPSVVIGPNLVSAYGRGTAPVLELAVSLVSAADLVPAEEAVSKSWDGERRVIWVGRLDPEKNPLALPEILALLRAEDRRWRLAVVGTGPRRAALEARVVELGLTDAVELAGYVPNGPALWEQYRRSHALLNVSSTEGLPQVFLEAHAAGIPVVATDVGGVAAALGGGARGLLVPPGDARTAASALERLAGDPTLRAGLIEAGLEAVSKRTIEIEAARLAAFVRRAVAAR